ncbi:RagB/SusD family nutrient uptake outer membrane protein [Chitinophagaceae bacterium 26-R-25]|nr:RagB/SusD family nutrient uptake outer membrane protein [Chitinophagaceae bacterium 26-R-25]
MNKKIYKITSLLLLVSICSCKKDFLNVVPKGSLIATTTADYNLLMNSISFYQYNNGLPTLLLGDDVVAEESVFQYQSASSKQLFQYQGIIYKIDDTPWEIQNYMGNIYACNKIINEVMTSTEGSDTQKKSLLAEARATRAWINFQLINFYGKPYVASTANTDQGFPIITTADVSQKTFSRGTVQEMYDFIMKDLTAAIPDLLSESSIQTRLSRTAAEGILGKVYLFMGKNNEALTQFNAAFAGIAASAKPAVLYDYNVTLAPGGSFLPIGFFGPHYPGNDLTDMTESILAKSSVSGISSYNGYSTRGLELAPPTQALFGSSDLRLQLYANHFDDGSPVPAGRIRKYAFQYAWVGLQLSDLYLLRAETRARLNDLPGATADVEYLRKHRMPQPDAVVPAATAVDQTALIKFIIEERQREFAQEGYRWFDMRRLSVDPIFSGAAYAHTLYTINGGTQTYPMPAIRLVMQLPPSIMAANPNFTNNQ